MSPLVLLSAIVFLPAAAALLIAFLPKGLDAATRYITLGVTIVVFALVMLLPFGGEYFDADLGVMQSAFNLPWIPNFNIEYLMGLDGISLPLVVLTALVSVFAMGASWSIKKHVKAYCVLFLLLETGMLGVFLALDFFLFYVFWEVMLLPMYFLIGVWGGERREYAAIKFFLYTLLGSVLMLIAILMLYFNSDLRAVAQVSDVYGDENAAVSWADLHVDGQPDAEDSLQSQLLAQNLAATWAEDNPNSAIAFEEKEEGVRVFINSAAETSAAYSEEAKRLTISVANGATAADVLEAVKTAEADEAVTVSLASGAYGGDVISPDRPLHSFNILALQAMGQHTGVFSRSLQWWCFVLLFIGFAIKVPAVPVHTWLPDAHVEAPTPISMILAGVLLKMGGYGIIRICYPICPFGGYDLMWVVCGIGVVSMIYGAFAALAQTDFKRMVAYSSVSHMGYVVLGLGVWSAGAGTNFNPEYWNMGVQGAMFQMIGHGISSAGMFFMVGIIYDRVHHRRLNEFGGLFAKMPIYTALAIGLFFAGLGLPGLCGFIGEVLVVLSVWKFSPLLAILSAFVVILTAAYILWALQRVYLGAIYRGPHEEDITPITPREIAIAAPLLALAIIFGVFPHHTVLHYMDATIERQVTGLAEWTRGKVATQEIETPEMDEETLAAHQAMAMHAGDPAHGLLGEQHDGDLPKDHHPPEDHEKLKEKPVAAADNPAPAEKPETPDKPDVPREPATPTPAPPATPETPASDAPAEDEPPSP